MKSKSNNDSHKKPFCYGTDCEKAWDMHKTNGSVFHIRVYSFLVSESMLLVSLATFNSAPNTLSYQHGFS